MTFESDESGALFMLRARRAYELGRARGALLRAALLATATAVVGTSLVDPNAWMFAPVTLVLWFVAWWRGGVLLQAAQSGLAAGAVTFMLPLSLLRPCCIPGAGGVAPVCTMPEMCVLVGAGVGLPLALLVLRNDQGRRLEAAVGLSMGALALASVKCSTLFAGEALGLLAGLGAGFAAAAAVGALRAKSA
ncbi:MAG TPA: hypothetical protein VFZ61_11365 [Polyangiales bacterium]